jgi:hypothetical protein
MGKNSENSSLEIFGTPTHNTELGVYVASKYRRYWLQGRRQATNDANLEYQVLVTETVPKHSHLACNCRCLDNTGND